MRDLKNKFSNSKNFIPILKNVFWLTGDKIIRIFVGITVTSLLARYLGPDNFGILNFCLAFIVIFSMISSLGLQNIVTREIIRSRYKSNKLLGTNFILQLFFSIFCVVLVIGLIDIIKPHDTLIKIFISILSFNLVFNSRDCIKYWFDSQVQSKYYVWVENGNYVLFSIIKIVYIYLNAPLIAFVWIFVFEACFSFLCLFLIYFIKGGRPNLWIFELKLAKKLLKDSWPILLSGVAINIYMRIDQIMLGQLIGNESVGVYSVAVRITESFYFIPFAIMISSFPNILQTKKDNFYLYRAKFQSLFEVMLITSLLIGSIVLIFSNNLILVLFGATYVEAASIVNIHIWILLFGFIAIVNTQWCITENLQKLNFFIILIGLILNMILNYILIVKFGSKGAAYATLISIALQSVVFNLFFKKTRIIFYVFFKSLLFQNINKFFKSGKI